MLPRSSRISAGQLDQVMKKGRIFHSSLFVLRILGGQKDFRIGVVAPQKIFRTAVSRNAARRKMYTATKLALCVSSSTRAHAALFSKQTLKDVSIQEMAADARTIFVKAGILR